MNSIKFLGTAGARFVVMKQLRASGGLWLTLDDTNILIDPGPGSLVRCLSSKPKLQPQKLDGIILTHRHLDHSNDVNVMIEAMTNGGYDRRGVVFAPQDALSDDPVILRYLRGYVERIEILKEKGTYTLKNISFSTPVKHFHGVETYGLNIQGKQISVSLITDTRYFNELAPHYTGDILIINVVRYEEKQGVEHLCIADVEKIIQICKPAVCILTHFGTTIIKNKPWEIATHLSEKTGVSVVAARDGMQVDLDHYTKS
ncbi:MAG: MBL fold metallo-hydrolase [Euryarchaeota archaeon]|nr:MBL fold metallo-hydrolase [Euryarchaeota archaeon]